MRRVCFVLCLLFRLTCAVGTSKKLKSWLRVINSNSKTRLSAEMSQGGLFCPTEGVPTEEYYIPSNAEKLQKLGGACTCSLCIYSPKQ